jgi:hypothetical protein
MNSQSPTRAGTGALKQTRRSWPLIAALLILPWSGCTHTYSAQIEAVAKSPSPSGLSYRISIKNPPLPRDDIREEEAMKYVRTALSGRGWYEAPKGATARAVVELDYGIGPSRAHEEEDAKPIIRDVPGATWNVPSSEAEGGLRTKSAPPERDVYVGDKITHIIVVTYEKHLTLTARENQPADDSRPGRDLWQVVVTCDDKSQDLRQYLPVLAAATINYIGGDTDGVVETMAINGDDPKVAFVKKGM